MDRIFQLYISGKNIGLVKLCEQYNLTLQANLTLQTSTTLHCFEQQNYCHTTEKYTEVSSITTFKQLLLLHCKPCQDMLCNGAMFSHLVRLLGQNPISIPPSSPAGLFSHYMIWLQTVVHLRHQYQREY